MGAPHSCYHRYCLLLENGSRIQGYLLGTRLEVLIQALKERVTYKGNVFASHFRNKGPKEVKSAQDILQDILNRQEPRPGHIPPPNSRFFNP